MENCFHLLELDQKFNLDNQIIYTAYINAQLRYHPDQLSGDLTKSAQLNYAYMILSDPFKRAQHIFDLNKFNTRHGTIDSKLITLLADPKKHLEARKKDMTHSFMVNDLQNAFLAWCDCQYLSKYISDKL
jgi:DnaJ-class molecular chaperone